MAQFPAFPLWTDAYLADTGHLTTIEHGAYLLLLMTMWRAGGSLPNDDKQLARYARLSLAQWIRIKPNMMPFFRVNPDSITQGRLTDELVAVKQKSERQSNSARAKWRKNRDMRHATVCAETPIWDMPEASQISASQTLNLKEEDKSSSILSETGSGDEPRKRKATVYPEAFESFWSSYPTTPNMSKKEAYEAWKKLDEEDRQRCANAVSRYRAFLKSKPTLETVHAVRFISQRRFDGYSEAVSSQRTALDAEAWQKLLERSRRIRRWSTSEWGPAPGQPGCCVPADLLRAGDGDGWQELERAA